MGVISESAVWEDSVLQIEVGDSVGGGPSAVANLQAQDLANRTKWLKENKFDASNFGEFYPAGITPTYVDATHFTVAGDLTAIFTKGRVLNITDTGGTFNAVCSASAYDAGTELTTVTIAGDTIDSGISTVRYAVNQGTSAIWESGENVNGRYIKFTDGTLFCHLPRRPFIDVACDTPTLTNYRYITSTGKHAILPAPAIDRMMSFSVSSCANNNYPIVYYAEIPIDNFTHAVFLFEHTNSTNFPSVIINITGIGRWY